MARSIVSRANRWNVGSIDAQPRSHQSTNSRNFSYIDERWDFSDTFDALQEQYKVQGSPVEVNFRTLVPFNSGVDRITHLIHSYPAKLLLNIPLFFLRCKQVGTTGHLRDPFCGSGTVLLEGALKGWRVSGADINPLARLISRVKLTYLDIKSVLAASTRVCKWWRKEHRPFMPVVDVNYWFTTEVQTQLGGLSAAIGREKDDAIRDFLNVCLSACIRRVSLADPRLSVPVRVSPDSKQWKRATECNVVDLFRTIVADNSRRVALLLEITGAEGRNVHISQDARGGDGLVCPEKSVDLIVTSPPYVGAQKYVRATSLNLGWLGLVPDERLRALEERTIGREHYKKEAYRELVLPEDELGRSQLESIWKKDPLRAHIASAYLIEMREAIKEMKRLVRKGGKLILVVGNNTVAGEPFLTSCYIKNIAMSLGLELELELVDDIRSRGLMTKRNRTAGLITREYIQLYAKP